MPTWNITVVDSIRKIRMTFEAEASSRAEALEMMTDFALSVPQGLCVVAKRLLSKGRLRKQKTPAPNMCTMTYNESLCREHDMISDKVVDHESSCCCSECRLLQSVRERILTSP